MLAANRSTCRHIYRYIYVYIYIYLSIYISIHLYISLSINRRYTYIYRYIPTHVHVYLPKCVLTHTHKLRFMRQFQKQVWKAKNGGIEEVEDEVSHTHMSPNFHARIYIYTHKLTDSRTFLELELRNRRSEDEVRHTPTNLLFYE